MCEMKALIVDDDPAIRSEIIDILEDLGHEYEEAGSVREARNKLHDGTFAYVLLDMELPSAYGKPLSRANGEGFLAEIRINHTEEQLPVIVVTGTLPDLQTSLELRQKGATAFVLKPLATASPQLRDVILKRCVWNPAQTVAASTSAQPAHEEEDTAMGRRDDVHWLTMTNHSRKIITWATWVNGVPYKQQAMNTSRIACKILKCLYRVLPGTTFVKDSEIMKAGGWDESQYYRETQRGLRAYNGVAKNRLTEIKDELGISFKHVAGGIKFYPPEYKN